MREANIKGAIFDMDGVIFDSEKKWQEALLLANRKYGLTFDEEYRRGMCGKEESLIRAQLRADFPGLDADAYRDECAAYVRAKAESGEVDMKPGFPELIAYLRENGYRIALATSTPEPSAAKLFQCKGLDMYRVFDACAFGNEVKGRGKPNPDIFELAASRISLPCEACVVLEDSRNGIRAAVAAGAVPVMVMDLIPPDDFCLVHAHRILGNLGEGPAVLAELDRTAE